MDRLSIVLTLAIGAVITGGFVIAVLALGYYNAYAIVGAGVSGFLLSWPASYWVSRRVKRQDPEWNADRIEETDRVPRPDEREV